jgi:hypothetical protein
VLAQCQSRVDHECGVLMMDASSPLTSGRYCSCFPFALRSVVSLVFRFRVARGSRVPALPLCVRVRCLCHLSRSCVCVVFLRGLLSVVRLQVGAERTSVIATADGQGSRATAGDASFALSVRSSCSYCLRCFLSFSILSCCSCSLSVRSCASSVSGAGPSALRSVPVLV